MTVDTEALEHGVRAVVPAGRVDALRSPALDETLKDLIKQGHTRLVVDFSRVGYVSSSGLKVLISARRIAKQAGGDIALARLDPRVREVLEMTGLDRLFRIYPSRAEALDALANP